MARNSTQFVCQACGAVHPRWAGRCDACGEWNSIAEEAKPDAVPIGGKAKASKRSGRNINFVTLDGEKQTLQRRKTGISEFDRVAGGGLVPEGRDTRLCAGSARRAGIRRP